MAKLTAEVIEYHRQLGDLAHFVKTRPKYQRPFLPALLTAEELAAAEKAWNPPRQPKQKRPKVWDDLDSGWDALQRLMDDDD